MSIRSDQGSEEEIVPLSIVFITIGTIILLTVMAIWIVAPSTMPTKLYNIAVSFLPEGVLQVLPTPATLAFIPTRVPDQASLALLPETPLDDKELPSHFASLSEITRDEPLAGQPTRIVIPEIGLDAPVVEIGLEAVVSNGQTFYQWQVPNSYEAGWHTNSARLGQPGNIVFNGHHNIYGEVFGDLVDLNIGDKIILYDVEQAYTYQVSQTEIFLERGESLSVRLENAKWIGPTGDNRITLVTCWPKTDNSHRLVIVAQPVAEIGIEESSSTSSTQ